MAQHKILLDSNSYFRLAKEIHPLLFQEFGEERHCLYVLHELENEYSRSPRLKTQFGWVAEPEFVANRSRRLTLSRQEKKSVSLTIEFLWDHVLRELPGPSRVDVTVLSHGIVLGIPTVTDDRDLLRLASAFDAQAMTTLQLMRLMLDCAHIEMQDVRRIAAYWSYTNDRPADFLKEYRRLFSEPPPP